MLKTRAAVNRGRPSHCDGARALEHWAEVADDMQALSLCYNPGHG
jgi:hypothetical protein